jgi:hypothetical protein
MDRKRITIDDGDLHIIIEGPSTKFTGQDLTTASIIAMISGADTHHWEKLRVEQGVADEVTPADQLYAAVLSAVTRHYAVDAMLNEDREVHSVLFDLIGDLVNKGRLRNCIRVGRSSEEDRPDDA